MKQNHEELNNANLTAVQKQNISSFQVYQKSEDINCKDYKEEWLKNYHSSHPSAISHNNSEQARQLALKETIIQRNRELNFNFLH